ncbi:MAG: HAMP domain-containing sensor histidine kinase [Thermoguttaceae bacterium]|jgi:signal transduction histidine kinase
MRRPIQIQLLVPTLSVVVLAIALASGASGYFGAMRERRSQEDSLRRVVSTLTEGRFPLTETVLGQMSRLSGAEFVFIDTNQEVLASTLSLSPEDQRRLASLPGGKELGETQRGEMGAQPSLELAGRVYLSQRTAILSRGPGAESGSLVVLYSQDRWSAATWQAAYPALVAGAVAVLAVVIVATLLARRFVRPIRQLGDQTARIAQGDFTPVGVGKVDDELRDLAVSINRMTERLGQYEREVRRSEQLRTLGQLGAGMAHQLRNAATGGRMAIELHQRQCSAANAEDLAVALRQLRLMESYLRRFLTLSRPNRQVHEIVPLAGLVDDVCALVRPACLHAGIELTALKPAGPLCVQGDAEELRQLLVNLVLNAVDATSGHEQSPTRIVVALEPIDANRCALCVRDSGPGPSAVVSARLFEPFVTDKPEGTGLGLFVARQIAEDHGGSIHWQRREGMTEFRVELPVVGQLPCRS